MYVVVAAVEGSSGREVCRVTRTQGERGLWEQGEDRDTYRAANSEAESKINHRWLG